MVKAKCWLFNLKHSCAASQNANFIMNKILSLLLLATMTKCDLCVGSIKIKNMLKALIPKSKC